MACGRDVAVEADPKRTMKTRMRGRLAWELGFSSNDRILDLDSDEEIESFDLVSCHRPYPIFGDYSPDFGCCHCCVGHYGAGSLDLRWGYSLGCRLFLTVRESDDSVVDVQYRPHDENGSDNDGRSRCDPSCFADVRSDVREGRHLHDVAV